MKPLLYSFCFLLFGYLLIDKCVKPLVAPSNNAYEGIPTFHRVTNRVYAPNDDWHSESLPQAMSVGALSYQMHSVSAGLHDPLPVKNARKTIKKKSTITYAASQTIANYNKKTKKKRPNDYITPLLDMGGVHQPFSSNDLASVGSEQTLNNIHPTGPMRIRPGGGSGSGTFEQPIDEVPIDEVPIDEVPIALFLLLVGIYGYCRRREFGVRS